MDFENGFQFLGPCIARCCYLLALFLFHALTTPDKKEHNYLPDSILGKEVVLRGYILSR